MIFYAVYIIIFLIIILVENARGSLNIWREKLLKLNNVSKTYLSKGKQKVEALKDVNLEIKDSGLVFILGKSGSGKSTLLNILGGIDGATSGEIFVDGHSFADFKQEDYDNYRNRYVGFIFQEFNLLNDFDVAGNVALALKLSGEKKISDKVTNALQSVGLSTDYLTRKTDELSGGEKQRVAIARAIVKDSKVILADEPTGNLDSGTGESIWNILKDLSKTKLVIVVTHDRESAEKYGDRIIEIADGRIISDSGEQTASKGQAQAFTFQKNSLSNAVCFKMGFNNLSQRKIKSISVVLLAIFTIFVILLTQVLLCFSTEKTIAKLVRDNGIEHIKITQGKTRDSRFGSYNYMFDSTAKYIEANTDYIKNNFVEGKQDILDVGLNFIGDALELDDNSFYVTSLELERCYMNETYSVEIDGKIVQLRRSKHPAEFLVGKKIYIGRFNEGGTPYYTLAGVIDLTKYDRYAEGAAIPSYFAKESFTGHNITCATQNAYKIPDVTLEFGGVKYSGEFESENSLAYVTWNGGKILTENGLQGRDEVELAGDEIVLSYEMYAKLFPASSKWSYVSTDLTEVLYVPQHIGQRFSFKLYDYETGDLICDAGELKLAGIGFCIPDSAISTMMTFVAGRQARNKINTALSPQRYFVEVASVPNLQKFLIDFRNNHNGYISYAGGPLVTSIYSKERAYAPVVYDFESDISLFKIIFLTIATVLSLILLLLVMNLISFSIMNRKKEIGILSAMGATNRDLTKIFLIETFLISAVTFVFNVVAIFVASAIFNKYFSSPINTVASFLRVDIFTFITLIAASFGLLLVAALIPIRKIIKLKPIDAIKNL